MPVVENVKDINEVVKDINFEDLDKIYTIKKKGHEPYNPNKHYYIIYDTTQNNKVNGLLGLPTDAENFELDNPDINHVAYLKDINENIYNVIKNSILSKDLIVFYDEDNDMIFYRRIFVELQQGHYDPHFDAFWNNDNIVKLKVIVLDSDENPDDDIQNIEAKILRQGGDIAPISNIKIIDAENEVNGNDDTDGVIKVNERKWKFKNQTVVTFDLNDLIREEISTIRIKATLENIDVKKWWLTAYLRFIKVDTEKKEENN